MRRRCPSRRQARLRLHHRCGKDRPLFNGVRRSIWRRRGRRYGIFWLRRPLSETRIPLFRDMRESLLP